MSAIQPTKNTGLIVDEFIRYATIHLTTVSGMANTVSLYPPLSTPAPGVVLWTGYSVTPATPSVEIPMVEDPIVKVTIGNNTYEVELETDPEVNKVHNDTRGEVEGVRQDPDAGGFGPAVKTLSKVKKVNGKSTNTTSTTTTPDISFINPDDDWVAIAMAYMIKKESFTPKASNDEGNPRLGYGTSQLFVSNTGGKLVTRTVKYGDTTTQENAIIVLEYQVQNTFKDKVVSNKPSLNKGGKDIKIRPADWDALKNGQKAACICFVYNCGSFTYHPNIAEAMRNKDYEAAAIGIENGPTRVAESGIVYPGLVKRRLQEAMMFRLPK